MMGKGNKQALRKDPALSFERRHCPVFERRRHLSD